MLFYVYVKIKVCTYIHVYISKQQIIVFVYIEILDNDIISNNIEINNPDYLCNIFNTFRLNNCDDDNII